MGEFDDEERGMTFSRIGAIGNVGKRSGQFPGGEALPTALSQSERWHLREDCNRVSDSFWEDRPRAG